MGDIINAGADLLGFGPASKAADATEDAARMSAEANRYAADLQYKMWQEQQKLQEPWRQAGEQALNKLIPLSDYQQFGMNQFQADPGYAFRLSEGQKALERSAAARAGLQSGSALKAAARFGQEMGSQEYMNAFNRYQTERAARLQPLQSLAGVGQTAANTLGQAAGQYGQTAGNLAMMGGANQANALLAGANIRASQYGNMGSALNTALNTDWGKVGNTVSGWFAPKDPLAQQYYTGTGGMGD